MEQSRMTEINSHRQLVYIDKTLSQITYFFYPFDERAWPCFSSAIWLTINSGGNIILQKTVCASEFYKTVFMIYQQRTVSVKWVDFDFFHWFSKFD